MFDLKGSKRNRFVRKPGKNSTLLDTNFKVNRNGLPIALKHKHKAYTSFECTDELVAWILYNLTSADSIYTFMAIPVDKRIEQYLVSCQNITLMD